MDDLALFCCQNSQCPDFGRRGAGNLTVTGRLGKAKQTPAGSSNDLWVVSENPDCDTYARRNVGNRVTTPAGKGRPRRDTRPRNPIDRATVILTAGPARPSQGVREREARGRDPESCGPPAGRLPIPTRRTGTAQVARAPPTGRAAALASRRRIVRTRSV
jgi:hypothetical protein